MNVPKVSVVIPLYNKAPYIKRAINSILSQTVQDFEIIVINDGSIDGGEKIVEEYCDSRIHLINQENKGVSVARNKGVEASSSDLIAFLDSDDEWLPEFLETILRLREIHPKAGIYSTAILNCYPLKKKRQESYTCIPSQCYGIDDGYEGIVHKPFLCAAIGGVFPGQTSSISIPKSIFLETGGFMDGCKMGEDLDLFARICLFHDYVHSTKPLAKYIHEDNNSATANTSLAILDEYPFEISIKNMVSNGLMENYEKWDEVNIYLDSLHIGRAGWYQRVGDKYKAKEELKKVTSPILLSRKRLTLISMSLPESLLPIARFFWKCIKMLCN